MEDEFAFDRAAVEVKVDNKRTYDLFTEMAEHRLGSRGEDQIEEPSKQVVASSKQVVADSSSARMEQELLRDHHDKLMDEAMNVQPYVERQDIDRHDMVPASSSPSISMPSMARSEIAHDMSAISASTRRCEDEVDPEDEAKARSVHGHL